MPIVSIFPTGSGGSGGGGIPLAPVTGISTLSSSGKAYLKWTDPVDTVVGDATLAAWAGTLLVRKAGSLPASRRDGTVVLDSKNRDEYKNKYFCDSGLSDGVTYYYKFFPYSNTNTYADDPQNEVTITPNPVPTGDVSNLKVVSQLNGRIQLTWTDPAQTVIQDGITLSTWASTKVVYKTGSYPTSPEDGTLAVNSTTRNGYSSSPLTVDGLTNGTTYYFALFSISTEGAVNANAVGRITAVPNKTKITAIPSQKGTLTYNGNEQTPEWNNYNTTQMTIGGTTKGTDANTYTAKFTPTDDYCWNDGSTAAKDITWTIGRAAITNTPSQSGTLTYTGSQQSPTWINHDPTQLILGGETTGIDAKEYNATFTPTSNYKWSDESIAAKTVKWTIGRATIGAIPAQSGSLTYSGVAQSPTWTGYDTTKMTIGGVISGTDAGSYNAEFTPNSNYQWSDKTTTKKTVAWTIGRANIITTPVQDGTLTYSGKAQSPTWKDYDTDKLTLGGTTSGTNAGSYDATFTPTKNYQWSDGDITAKTVSWTIGRLAVTATPTQANTLTYNGSSQSPTWNNADNFTVSGTTSGINAGTYSASFTPTSNYKWQDGSTAAKNVSWTIGRATITTVPSQSGTLTYTGSAQSPNWSNYDTAKMTLGGTTSGINAGNYNATFTPTDNYKWSDNSTTAKTVAWTIGKATVSLPTQSGTLTYNGKEQTPSWSGYDTAKLTIGGTTKGTTAGSYNATFTPTANYQWSDGTNTAKTATWSIGKAAGSVSVSPSTLTLDSSKTSGTVSVTRSGTGAVTASSSDQTIATVTVNGTTLTINSVNNKSGTATITVKVAADNNYNAPADAKVTVDAQFVPAQDTLNNMSWENIRKVSDAGLASTYWAVGDRKAITINGTVGTLAVNGTYYVHILGFDHNSTYEGKGIHFGGFCDSSGKNLALCDSKYGSNGGNTGAKCFQLNHWGSTSSPYNTNYGGWSACDMRYDILGSTDKQPSVYGSTKTTAAVGYDASTNCAISPVQNTLMAALPSDLRAVMKPMTKYSDNKGGGSDTAGNVTATVDYLPLLAEFEVQGARSYANSAEKSYQEQYEFYKTGNNKVKYRHDSSGTAVFWWLRSVYSSNTSYFCIVNAGGSAGYYTSRDSYGVAPAFKV